MCPSRNGNYLCRQIFLSQTTGWRLLHGNSAWDCHAFSLHRFQQNCPLERCLSKQAWNHPGSGIVSISFLSNPAGGQNHGIPPQIFYLQDNLNTIESLLCIKSTLDLKKMQWHWFWKDGWKALMEIWTPSAWLLHFGSKQKTYLLLFLALPHETLMSKHFIREFWTLHFICKIGRDEILGIWESRDFTPFLTYPNLT